MMRKAFLADEITKYRLVDEMVRIELVYIFNDHDMTRKDVYVCRTHGSRHEDEGHDDFCMWKIFLVALRSFAMLLFSPNTQHP